MLTSRNLPYFFILLLAISSCKVTKVTDQSQQVPDSLAIRIDTSATKVDTVLTKVQDSVDIRVHRLLKDTLTIIGVGDIMMGTNYPDTPSPREAFVSTGRFHIAKRRCHFRKFRRRDLR